MVINIKIPSQTNLDFYDIKVVIISEDGNEEIVGGESILKVVKPSGKP